MYKCKLTSDVIIRVFLYSALTILHAMYLYIFSIQCYFHKMHFYQNCCSWHEDLANWFWLGQYCSASAASTRQSESRKPVCREWRQHRRSGGSPHPARPRSSSFYTTLQIQPEKYEARKQKKLQVKSYTHEISLSFMPLWTCCQGCHDLVLAVDVQFVKLYRWLWSRSAILTCLYPSYNMNNIMCCTAEVLFD